MFNKPVKFLLSLCAAASLLTPAVLLAADAPPPLADMWVVTPKAGHGAEFRKALAEHMALRSKHGDSRNWEVYTPLLGDDLDRYAIRYCCFNWADQDSYEAWQAGAKEVSEDFQKNVGPHTETWSHYFESMDWGNSHWVDNGGHYKLFAVTEFKIKPGHGMDFNAAREKMSQIALNQGWATDNHPWLWASTIGGPAVESVIIPHMNFASFDRSESSFMNFLAENMGEEAAAALLKQFSGAAESSNFQIWEYREELSTGSAD